MFRINDKKKKNASKIRVSKLNTLTIRIVIFVEQRNWNAEINVAVFLL